MTAVTPLVAVAFAQHWARLQPAEGTGSEAACLQLLSRRERDVIDLVCQGFTSAAIAALLQVGLETVKTHRKRAYRKLRISSQAELLALMQPSPAPINYHA